MSPRDVTLECLTKAEQGMDFVLTDLKQTNAIVGPVEHLPVIDMIRDATALQQRIAALLAAFEARRPEFPQLKAEAPR